MSCATEYPTRPVKTSGRTRLHGALRVAARRHQCGACEESGANAAQQALTFIDKTPAAEEGFRPPSRRVYTRLG